MMNWSARTGVHVFLGGVVVFGWIGCSQYEVRIDAITQRNATEDVDFRVPETVVAGRRFYVNFTTLGGACEKDHFEEVEPRPSGVRITPYSLYPTDEDCISILLTYARQVDLVFEQSGDHVVELRGRPNTLYVADELVSVERLVTVTHDDR
jgi:hypothetical protein